MLLATSDFSIVARSRGFIPASKYLPLVGLQPVPCHIDLALDRGPTIVGYVLEPTERPAAKAQITIHFLPGNKSLSNISYETELSCSDDRQELFSIAPGAGLIELEFVLIDNPPTGQVEVTLRDLDGAVLNNYDLDLFPAIESCLLNSALDGYSYIGFEGPGPHTVPTGYYRASLNSYDIPEPYALDIDIDLFEVREGQTIHIDETIETGGRVAFWAQPFADPDAASTSIYGHFTDNRQQRETVVFQNRSEHPPHFISNEVFPAGFYTFEINKAGYEPILETLYIIAGVTAELKQRLIPVAK